MEERIGNQAGKITVLELFLIICISLMSIFVIYKGVKWIQANTAHGNDSMLVNTAESEARINSGNGAECVVQDCPSKTNGLCTHVIDAKGTTVGYLDKITKHIVGEKPYGYNEYREMNIGDQTYYGDVNTMVIQVAACNGEVSVSWVPGRSNE